MPPTHEEGPESITTDDGLATPSAGLSRPGLGTFTIEGRRAPGLFVVGWLATLLGGGLAAIGLLAFVGGGGAGMVVLVLVGWLLLAVGLVAGAGSQALERRARHMAGYTGPSPVLVFAATIPTVLLVQTLVFLPLVAAGLDTSSPLALLLSLLLTAAAYLALVRLLVVGTEALTWREMGVRRPAVGDVPDIAYGAVLAVPLVFVTTAIALVMSQFLPTPPETLPPTTNLAGSLANLISAMLIAPIAEEIFFRGFATTAWWRGVGAEGAVIRGAVLFAAAHMLPALAGAGDPREAVFAFLVRIPVALALGWVFVRRRSLFAAIGLHVAFNGIPVLALLFGAG